MDFDTCKIGRFLVLVAVAGLLVVMAVSGFAVANDGADAAEGRIAVIPCKGGIDDGLLQSIKRRSELAISEGATYLVFDIQTYGGALISADDISKYFILDLGNRVHTVAYVSTEAISAGALISVSCKDIIMLKHTTIGDCAPIIMGGKLEGVEREKVESPTRAFFVRAAEANGYPEALLKAMVSQQLEVWRVKNIATGEYEFFEKEDLPKDEKGYDLANKELIDKDDELLTLTSARALEYGIARAEVGSIDEAISFLAERDGISFVGGPKLYDMLWSEQMVRAINSPAVMGVLVMLAMLGVYIELNSPGLGLPGLVAVVCGVIIIGSKYMVGLANWVEVAVFAVGLVLIAVEIFIIPGFGVAGILGLACIFAGGFGMLVKNAPDKLPIPRPEFGGWAPVLDGMVGVSLGFIGFVVCAALLAKYLPKIQFLNGLTIKAATARPGMRASVSAGPEMAEDRLDVGGIGRAVSILRPCGQADFDGMIADVVADGEYIDEGVGVVISEIHGNRIVVRKS